MIPAFLLINFSSRSRIPLALPLFLLWPLVALFALIVGLLWLVLPESGARFRGFQMARGGLALLWHLSGLTIDVHSEEDHRVYMRFI